MAFCFVVFHGLLLLYYPLKMIDSEALHYGEFAAAFAGGIAHLGDIYQFLLVGHEGSMLLLTPFIIPFFFILGPTYFALHFAGVVMCSSFVIAWLIVFRKIFTVIPTYLIAALFIVPFPFLQNSALTVSSIMTHLGATTWLGALFLLAFQLKPDLVNAKQIALILLLAFLSCLGVFHCRTLAALLPGICFFIFRSSRPLFKLYVSGLMLFSFIPLATTRRSSHLDFDQIAPLGEIFSSAYNIFSYLPYFLGPHAPALAQRGSQTVFLPAFFIYFLLFLLLVLRGKSEHIPIEDTAHRRAFLSALAISSLCMFVAILASPFRNSINKISFDGMRHFTPFLPIVYAAFLWAIERLPKLWQARAVTGIIAINLAGAILFIYPFQMANFYFSHRGYIGAFPIYMNHVEPERILRSPLRGALLPWMGIRAFRRDGIKSMNSDFSAKLNSTEKNLYWMGIGVGQELGNRCIFNKDRCEPSGAPEEQRLPLMTGWALAIPCELVEEATSLWTQNHRSQLIAAILQSKIDCQKFAADDFLHNFSADENEKTQIPLDPPFDPSFLFPNFAKGSTVDLYGSDYIPRKYIYSKVFPGSFALMLR